MLMLSALMLLSSCENTNFENSSVCPKPVYYSPEQQDMFYIALANLEAGNPLISAMNDYKTERAMLEACRGM